MTLRRVLSRLMILVAALLVCVHARHASAAAWRRTRPMCMGSASTGTGGTPSATPSCQGRANHTATLLGDGRILIVGGSSEDPTCLATGDPATDAPAGCALGSAAVYDPVTSTWTRAAPMSFARVGHTATLLLDGTVLVAGGWSFGDSSPTPALRTAEVYDPIADRWTLVGSMAVPRVYHTATQIADGRVLVVGGAGMVANAELYDPATKMWSSAGSTTTARASAHSATLLYDGRVLVAGGFTEVVSKGQLTTPTTAAAEAWSPKTNTWKAVASLHTARAGHTATSIANPTSPQYPLVLVVGGNDGRAGGASMERFDAHNDAWVPGASMSVPRFGHTATLIPNPSQPTRPPRVLVAGGSMLADGSAEVFDPQTLQWSSLPPMNVDRRAHTATPLQDGRVLFVGGAGTPALASAETFEPSGGLWTTVGDMIDARRGHTATALVSSKVLVAGGVHVDTTEVFDPEARSWTKGPSLSSPRWAHTATRLQSGDVLVAGGFNADGQQTTAISEVFDAAGGFWKTPTYMAWARFGHTATLLPNGQVLVAGGFSFMMGGGCTYGDLFDPATREWTATKGQLTTARYYHTATLLADGRVLVAGGRDPGGNYFNTAELFHPDTGTWTQAGSMVQARAYHTATLLDGGKVLVTGGGNGPETLATAEVYDPNDDAWTRAPPMSAARRSHLAALLDGGRVLVAAGYESTDAQVFDPNPSPAWTAVASTTMARSAYAAAPIPGGLLLTGGNSPTVTPITSISSAEVFQPKPAGELCKASFECASGSCHGGVCCSSACSGGCTSCSIADGAPEDGTCYETVSCGVYRCGSEGPEPSCFTVCTTSAECAPGYACDASQQCVVPKSPFVGDACAVSPRPASARVSRSPFEPAAVAFLALLAALRRRPSKLRG